MRMLIRREKMFIFLLFLCLVDVFILIRLWDVLDKLEHVRNLPVEDFCTKEDFPTQKENRSVNGDYLWKVSRDNLQHPFYLFGTMHVEAKLVLNSLSERTKTVYLESDSVIFEIDFLKPFEDCNFLPDGKTLEDFIPNELLVRMETHIRWLESQTGLTYDDLAGDLWLRLVPEHLGKDKFNAR